ncbi:hypothetical protein QJ48_33215 [Paenibacillus sp. A3]|nr:hypothetical protein QJ48_33215 [Paenibacillus sp. A3]
MFIFLMIHVISLLFLYPLKKLYPKVIPLLRNALGLEAFEVNMYFFAMVGLYYYWVYQTASKLLGH